MQSKTKLSNVKQSVAKLGMAKRSRAKQHEAASIERSASSGSDLRLTWCAFDYGE